MKALGLILPNPAIFALPSPPPPDFAEREID
jgi:hypothetical protein